MKVRNDYVSNSSSCSFIVKLNTDDDVKNMKEYTSLHKNICDSGYESIEAAVDYWNTNRCINPETVEPGECLYVYVGEDHDEYTIDELFNVADDLKALGLELYADPDAHCTVGEKLPKQRH